MRVFRHNLSGGVIGPDLKYRADLEHYKKANLLQTNFLPTVYGGLMRRPPAELVAALGADVTAARMFEFIYSSSERYIAVLERVDDAPDYTQFEFYNAAGALVDTVACTGVLEYLAADFDELQVKQLNDVMYIAHNGYPLARLERLSATSFQIIEAELNGGPFLDWNTDDAVLVSTEPNVWVTGDTYAAGDVVYDLPGTARSISAAAYVFWRSATVNGTVRDYYVLRITIPATTYQPGDTIYIENMPNVVNGFKAVVNRYSSTKYDINIGTYYDNDLAAYVNQADLTGYPSGSPQSKVWDARADNAFYVSLVDGNTGHSPPSGGEDAYWRNTAQFNELALYSNVEGLGWHLGQLIMLEVDKAAIIEGSFNSTDDVSEPYAYPGGTVLLRTEGGVWGGQLNLEESLDGGNTWAAIGFVNGAAGWHNGEITRDITDPRTLLRVRMETFGSVAASLTGTVCRWQLEFPSGAYFIGEVTGISSDYMVLVKAKTSLIRPFQTSAWRLGAFSSSNGYPGTVTVHEERLMLGGTTAQPFMIWGSQVNNWTNFSEGSLATSALSIQANADRATRLSWMVSKGELAFGTDFNEYTAGQRDSDTVMSVENVPKVILQSSYTGKALQAALIGENIVFVQADGMTLRALRFSADKWGYTGEDITIFNPDITGGGIRAMAVQKAPFSILWCVTDDGDLVSFTYDTESNIAGWAQHDFDGDDVVSVAVLPTSGDDEVYVVLDRAGVLKVEKMDFTATEFLDGGADAFYSTVIPSYFVQAEGVLEEMRYRVVKVFLYLKTSKGGQVSADGGTKWESIDYGNLTADANGLYTGKVEVNVNSGHTETAAIIVRTNGEESFNLLAIGADINLHTSKE